MLLVIPLILALISGFKGDKAEHEEKRKMEKLDAVSSGDLVLETDLIRRKQYLRLPKLLVLACLSRSAFLLSFLVLYFSPRTIRTSWRSCCCVSRSWRWPAQPSIFAVIPLLLYWANCSGTSLVQRVYLSENRLCYTGYSGSMDQRGGICLCPSPAGRLFCWEDALSVSGEHLPGRQRTPTVRIRKAPFPRRSGFPAPFR